MKSRNYRFIPAPVTDINGYRILQLLSAVIMAGAGFYLQAGYRVLPISKKPVSICGKG